MKVVNLNVALVPTPLYARSGKPLIGTHGQGDAKTRPLAAANTVNFLRYDLGTVGFGSFEEGARSVDYDERQGEVTTDDDSASASNDVSVSCDHYALYNDAPYASYAQTKEAFAQTFDRFSDRARGFRLDVPGKVGAATLTALPRGVYANQPTVAGTHEAYLLLTDRATASFATYENGNPDSANLNVRHQLTRRVEPCVWMFPTCAPGCVLALPLRIRVSVDANYRPAHRADLVYPHFTPTTLALTAYAPDEPWSNNLDFPLALHAVAMDPIPLGALDNPASSVTKDVTLRVTVPPARILFVWVDPEQFLPWVDSAIRSFPGYERTGEPLGGGVSTTLTVERRATIRVELLPKTPSSANYAVPIAP